MRRHDAPAGLLRHAHGLNCLSDCANLVHLEEQSIASLGFNGLLHTLGVGHRQVIAHNLQQRAIELYNAKRFGRSRSLMRLGGAPLYAEFKIKSSNGRQWVLQQLNLGLLSSHVSLGTRSTMRVVG